MKIRIVKSIETLGGMVMNSTIRVFKDRSEVTEVQTMRITKDEIILYRHGLPSMQLLTSECEIEAESIVKEIYEYAG